MMVCIPGACTAENTQKCLSFDNGSSGPVVNLGVFMKN